MCGIFGIVHGGPDALPVRDLDRITRRLFLLSESRGKEASGLTLIPSLESDRMLVVKSPATAALLLKEPRYQQIFKDGFFPPNGMTHGLAFGHTRLVTNGSQLDDHNNQPVIRDEIIAVHNGIIVNVDELWRRHVELKRHSEVDTEVLLALVRKYYRATQSPIEGVRQAFAEIRGTASVAMTFADLDLLILATNHGSLYVAEGAAGRPRFFASEQYTLRCLLRSHLGFDFTGYQIAHVPPNRGVLVNLRDGSRHDFDFAQTPAGSARAEAQSLRSQPESAGSASLRETPSEFRSNVAAPRAAGRKIEVFSVGRSTGTHSVFDIRKVAVPRPLQEEFARVRQAVAGLKRCTRCVLPETVPFIAFDEQGVCNFCRFHQPVQLKGREALEKMIAPYRRPGTEADCVCSISGGRDSCYGLHYIVKELGLKPLAYTYDWGMVTDLARRNTARMCSQLGVEHILISADIPKKRENIRKNVEAWLHKPHIGMIPLFMAGDKQFVWYGNRVKRQTGLELDFFTFNLFEKTQFKEEYTGIQFWKPGADADKLGEELGIWRGVKLCSYYGHQFLTNWKYLNSSVFDTFYGFVTYYIMPRSFEALFRYVEWREDEVVDVLRNQYDWELATDTQSSWRIGDGTASFYNYIYYTLGGFTEHDTLRSGQVRAGHLTREDALRRVEADNQPRWDSFKWYCDIIGIDFESTVKRINAMPRTSPKLVT